MEVSFLQDSKISLFSHWFSCVPAIKVFCDYCFSTRPFCFSLHLAQWAQLTLACCWCCHSKLWHLWILCWRVTPILQDSFVYFAHLWLKWQMSVTQARAQWRELMNTTDASCRWILMKNTIKTFLGNIFLKRNLVNFLSMLMGVSSGADRPNVSCI